MGRMEYRAAQEIAEEWGLTDWAVQKRCAAGRIPGARKFGRPWAVPAMQCACGAGVIQGGANPPPKDGAARAEAAAMPMRCCQLDK